MPDQTDTRGADMGDENKVAGKIKEIGGKVTGDDRLETEGKVQNAKGKVESAVDEAREKAKGALEGLRGDPGD
jgi:uncharacterized protein YjbJ (UPF0337 family)